MHKLLRKKGGRTKNLDNCLFLTLSFTTANERKEEKEREQN